MDHDTYIKRHLDNEIDDILAEGSENESNTEPMIGPPAPVRIALTALDVRRLTLFKWRYSLESAGFSSHQADHMLFLKWMNARRPEAVR